VPGVRDGAGRVHETVLARPRDVRRAGDPVRAWWVKRRWKCDEPGCGRKTFTEGVPQVPPRCRLTRRLREQAGAEVAERGITPAEAARYAGVSWPVADEAFAAAADPVLDQAPAPVAHLGIDEHRRGRPRWRTDEQTGEYELLADRWHTCFFDLSGDQGLLGQVEGRTADDAAYWLAQAAPAWRDAVRVVAIDMCSIYASAVRRMLPGARIAVDLFHVVHLAVKMTGDVRRRVVRGKYGRRGRSGDPEYGIKNLLVRNLEHLSPAQFAKVTGALHADAGGQEIAAAWIGKEKLRHALNLRARVTGSSPCERNVRDRLFAFYDWCACNDDIPELLSLAKTVSRWENEIVCAVLTGVTNAASESLNRLAKLEARLAYGFRNPSNQRRRVRIACTRARRRPSRTATTRRTRTVMKQKPDPG
jgi:transposase